MTTPRSKPRQRRSRSRGRGMMQNKKASSTSPIIKAPSVTKPSPVKKPFTTPRTRSFLTTRDLSPSRYSLRYSTIKQRPPLHMTCFSSDDEEPIVTPFKIHSPTNDTHKETLPTPSLPAMAARSHSPNWMNLGVAEMILCLLMLAMVIACMWYFQNRLKTTTST